MNINISLVWIKAHAGHPGNERADCLAKNGTESDTVASWVKCPINSYKARSGIMMVEEWNKEWRGCGIARMSKQFFPDVNIQRSSELIKLNRDDLTLIVTMTTGHNDLRYHSSLREPTISPYCRLCNLEKETFFHLLGECPRLNKLRFDIYGVHQMIGDVLWDTEYLLEFIKSLPFNLRQPASCFIHSFSSTSLFNSESSFSSGTD